MRYTSFAVSSSLETRRDLLAHDVRDRGRQERVVRAAEHERVDVGGLQRREVLLGDREQLVAARDAGLDELDESRARLREQLEVRAPRRTRRRRRAS